MRAGLLGKQSRGVVGLVDAMILLSDSPSGKLCIEVTPADKIANISEQLCIGCGICVKVSITCTECVPAYASQLSVQLIVQ